MLLEMKIGTNVSLSGSLWKNKIGTDSYTFVVEQITPWATRE